MLCAIAANFNSSSKQLIVHSFVLSCRFFARGLEYFFLDQLRLYYGAETLQVHFVRSKRNSPAANFLVNISSDSHVKLVTRLNPFQSMSVPIDIEKLFGL